MKNNIIKTFIIILSLLTFLFAGCNNSSNSERISKKNKIIEEMQKDKENKQSQFLETVDEKSTGEIHEPEFADRSDIN